MLSSLFARSALEFRSVVGFRRGTKLEAQKQRLDTRRARSMAWYGGEVLSYRLAGRTSSVEKWRLWCWSVVVPGSKGGQLASVI